MATSVWFMYTGGVLFGVYFITGLIQILATYRQELKATDLAASGAEEDFENRVVYRLITSPSLEDYENCTWLGGWVFLLGLIGYLSPGGLLTILMLVGATLFVAASYILDQYTDKLACAVLDADQKRLSQDPEYRATIKNSIPLSPIAECAPYLRIVGVLFFLFGVTGCIFF